MKPKVKLVDEDGNAFSILGRCLKEAKKSNWSKEEIERFMTEARSGDYDDLLRIVMKYFEVK